MIKLQFVHHFWKSCSNLVVIFFDLNLTFDLYLQLSKGREEASSKGFNGSILFAETKLDCEHIQLGEEEKREGRRGEKSGEGGEEEKRREK